MNWSDIVSTSAVLFLIMDPFGNVPMFNVVLSKLERRRRSRVVARELLIALFILLGFLLAGNWFMNFLGLSQESLCITGGFLLLIISVRMIFPSKNGADSEADMEDPFIVPLAVPYVAGPSTIAVLLLLSSEKPDQLKEWCTALFLAWIGTTAILLFSPVLLKLIGSRGSRAMERLMGMILVMLSIQMLLNGIRDFMADL